MNGPRFIAVEGPIGVGKTTLARRFSERMQAQMLFEPSEENPFLDSFYRDRASNALSTQLFFLLHRSEQLKKLQPDDLFTTRWVADYIIEKDRLFAEMLLDEHELELYNQIFAHLTIQAPKPDLVIYLQAPSNVLLQRIRQRGIAAEQLINGDYLDHINEAYTRFFHYFDTTPLLIVNAAEIDLVNDDTAFDALFSRAMDLSGGRHYFNLQPSLI